MVTEAPHACQSNADYGTESDDHHPKYEVEKKTCLSNLYHEDKPIKDHLAHYFGCIELCERHSFFDNEKLWKGVAESKKISVATSIVSQLKRIQVLRKAVDSEKPELKTAKPLENGNDDHTAVPSLVANVKSSHKDWQKSLEYTEGIAKVIKWRNKKKKEKEKEKNTHSNTMRDGTPDARAAAANFRDSHDPKGKSEALTKLIERINELAEHDSQQKGSDKEEPSYSLEKDVNAYIIRFKANGKDGSSGLKLCDFESSENSEHIKSHCPDQRIALKYLLRDPDILCKYKRKEGQRDEESKGKGCIDENSKARQVGNDERKENRPITDVRYIHIPSNNMHWAEKLIERYYGMTKTRFDEEEEASKKSEARMILRPQYWRGQHHGAGNDLVHARHMRPICEMVSSDPNKAEEVAKNIVLFMPYLHWETDRKREAVACMIDEKVDKFRKRLDKEKLTELENRVAERKDLDSLSTSDNIVTVCPPEPGSRFTIPDVYLRNLARTNCNPKDQFDTVAWGLLGKTNDCVTVNPYGRLEVKNALGQFLLDAARLYEAIANHRDKKMIDSFLFGNAPLHPRRTLDQAHFCTLKSTRARDRDQVVFRSTSIKPKNMHRLEKIDKKKGFYPTSDGKANLHWTCDDTLKDTAADFDGKRDKIPGEDKKFSPSQVICVGSGTDGESNETSGSMSGLAFSDANSKSNVLVNTSNKDKLQKSHHRCEHCRENIRKVARVVMVDQLWMWILDENTIITCFPRRYGANKRDESGVHNSIRARLKAARENQFRSVYDIALLILDECSNTFFDRTKTSENLPQVMNLFSEAIGNVAYQQTNLFYHLWYWTEKASKMYRTKAHNSDVDGIYTSLLDINPEGKIQREIKDIMEELDIMLRFHRKQCEIVKRFTKNVQRIMGGSIRTAMAKNRSKWPWFRTSAAELQSDMNDRVQELQNLKKYAESTAQSVNDLMALKQQQASVVQTWQSVQQAEETVKQGRAIMVFTIITIVFLPLSFMSSIFGMNNSAFGGNSWSLTDQFRLMFPVSVAIIMPVILLAYSSFMRSIIWSGWKIGTTFVMVWLYIYYAWLSIRHKWASENMSQRAKEKVQALHKRVNQQRVQHLMKKWQKEREDKERKPILG